VPRVKKVWTPLTHPSSPCLRVPGLHRLRRDGEADPRVVPDGGALCVRLRNTSTHHDCEYEISKEWLRISMFVLAPRCSVRRSIQRLATPSCIVMPTLTWEHRRVAGLVEKLGSLHPVRRVRHGLLASWVDPVA
jgi:hypothetical protein